ncbi:MAG: hypothetical protein JW966_08120 [Anaerolineae bacterium]|nr:hypothetical protein [Anaerolineae bacterium]
MNDIARLIVTSIIWIAVMSALMAMLLSDSGAMASADSDTVFKVVLTLAAAATLSTGAIWAARPGSSQQQTTDVTRLAKPKRMGRTRIERLVEALDDDEIYDLEALLLARNEEHRDSANHF